MNRERLELHESWNEAADLRGACQRLGVRQSSGAFESVQQRWRATAVQNAHANTVYPPGFCITMTTRGDVFWDIQRRKKRMRKTILGLERRSVNRIGARILCLFALLPLAVCAATNDFSSALQQGLFEEEANRNLPAAI